MCCARVCVQTASYYRDKRTFFSASPRDICAFCSEYGVAYAVDKVSTHSHTQRGRFYQDVCAGALPHTRPAVAKRKDAADAEGVQR